ESGMGAVQIAPVAHRADIAAGTVYRYFPSKKNPIADATASAAGRELAAMREAADAAPGPLSALAACIATFAARALNDRRLTWAVLAEPVDANIDALRVEFRRAIASELAWRINVALTGQHLPDQDVRATVQTVTLLSLRAVGVVDARARGLVAQCPLPQNPNATSAPAPSSIQAA